MLAYNCISHDLGPIYVGQTVKTYFKLLQSTHNITTLQVVGSNDLSLNSCNIKYQYELIQTSSSHNHGCNEYSYTVWANGSTSSSCGLYLKSA